MGLAEPRKRVKISHDPRNLNWSAAENSYGQQLMRKHGWKAGEALGARKGLKVSETDAAKLRISVKDDTLGLGASLKSKDVQHQRTGLDAFQGLLGRLNAKDEKNLQEVEKKIEDRKLAMWAQGKWGGMVFVPGGLLVQKDPNMQLKNDEDDINSNNETTSQSDQPKSESAERNKRKAEKRQRKEERRARKEARRIRRAQKASTEVSEKDFPTPTSEISSAAPTPTSEGKASDSATITSEKSKNGRYLLRGRNIQAKRSAFSDIKMLDQIFMKRP